MMELALRVEHANSPEPGQNVRLALQTIGENADHISRICQIEGHKLQLCHSSVKTLNSLSNKLFMLSNRIAHRSVQTCNKP